MVETAAASTSTGLKDFFGVRIEEEYLEVFIRTGGQEYMVCEGYLGGRCVADESCWDFKRFRRRCKGKGKDKGAGKGKSKTDKGVLALKVSVAKAFSKMNWNPVFDRQDIADNDCYRRTADGVPFLD